MPEDKDTSVKPNIDPGTQKETELSSNSLDSSPLPGPVPEIEQEPQTSSLAATATTQPSSADDVSQASVQPQPVFATGPSQTPGGAAGNKKKWIIGGIIAAVVVLLVGGGALAYSVYQSPDKVIGDGLVHMFDSQPHKVNATISAANDQADFNLAFDLKSNDKVANGTVKAKVNLKEQDLSFDGSVDIAATVDGDGYIKINDADTLVNKIADAVLQSQVEQYRQMGMTITDSQIAEQKKEMLSQIKPIIDKVNNRWIKFSTDERKDDQMSEMQKCVTDTFKKLDSDKTMRDELARAYSDNKFMIVKEQLGVKDGSYGYVLDFDKDKSKAFGDAAEKTTFVKELQKCSGESASSSTPDYSTAADDSVKNMRIELWVSQWSHQITAFTLEGTDTSSTVGSNTKVSFNVTLGYDEASDVTVPSDAVDFKELQKEFENMSPATTRTSSASLST